MEPSERPVEWELYVSGTGRTTVAHEILKAKLTNPEAQLLDELQRRYARGEALAKDAKTLKQLGLEELRLFADHRSFRLVFVRRGAGLILLALTFAEKKSAALPKSVVARAVARRDEWDSRHPLR